MQPWVNSWKRVAFFCGSSAAQVRIIRKYAGCRLLIASRQRANSGGTARPPAGQIRFGFCSVSPTASSPVIGGAVGVGVGVAVGGGAVTVGATVCAGAGGG